MVDAWHQFGGDMLAGPTGDLVVVAGATAGQQRLLRRLLTNPGDYIWDVAYGAGLGRFVGMPVDVARIQAVVRGQIFKEAAVARQPEPVIEVAADGAGTVAVQIRYVDARSGATQSLSFSLSNG